MVVDQLWDDEGFEEPQALPRDRARGHDNPAKSVTGVINKTTATTSATPPEFTSYNFVLPEAEMPSLKLNQARNHQLQREVLQAEASMAAATEAFSVAAIRVEKCEEMVTSSQASCDRCCVHSV